MNYRHDGYDVTNQRLDHIASRVSSLLQCRDYRALPIRASQTVDEERLCGAFSHKMGAHLAGLDWMGKSCLLITPEVGPRVQWATVLTDAPLKDTGEPRDVRYAAHKCDRYFAKMEKTTGLPVCGLYLYVCSKKFLKSDREEEIMPGPGAFLVGEEERREVEDVLESGYLSRYGREDDPRFKRKVVTLEREFARRWEVKYCVAVNGGTSAIMASLVALGVGPGVEVLVPGYTFIASISAIILACGTPVLTEVDESLTMDPDDIEEKITENTKVIMPVHMLGNPADMDRIMTLAKKHHLFVLEDVCQGLGATYKGKPLGSIGHVGAFSLNINKTITCGDGGIVITNDKDCYERAFGFHDQGHKPLRMGVEIGKRSIIGMNLRMHELSAAFALAQLNKLDNILNLLREKKGKFRKIVSDANMKNMHFRKINDPGECNTLFTVIFDDKEPAEAVAKALGTITVSGSGWHVYNNMEQLLAWTDRGGNNPYQKHMLPQTDDILDRTINISVGVVDPGLGAGFGINILSSDEEIEQKAEQFVKTVKDVVG